MLATAESQTIH